MNALNEIHSEAQTATNAILNDLSDGCARSAKQIYERSEVLEDRQEANKVLWEMRQRGYVESAPATGDISDSAARLVWSITDAGRAYLAGAPVAVDEDIPDDAPVEQREVKAKQKTKPSATKVSPSGKKYLRDIKLVNGRVDVYAVLVAFGVTCPARQHAIKKLLCAGLRGKGDEAQDLAEARDAVTRAIELL